LFFDANGNGNPDLYVLSGGLEFGNGNTNYQDRLCLNDGKGNFTKSLNQIPVRFESSSFVKAIDHNGDGNLDLLVGTRNVPFAYGLPGDVLLLENQGEGIFVDKTNEVAVAFKKLGMTRDAWSGDLDGDGLEELLIVGEWMPVKVFKKVNGIFEDQSEAFGFGKTGGIWNTIHVADVNGDGKLDILLGNMGLNNRLRAGAEKPMQLHVNDFDQNGSVEQILTQYEGEFSYPLVMKNTLLKQLPGLRKQLLTYDDYKDKRLEDLFDKEILSRNVVHDVHTLETSLFLNRGDGRFEKTVLPSEVQYSPVYAIYSYQDKDGNVHLLFGGNQSRIKPELGINMGSYGWHLVNKKGKEFKVIPAAESGFFVKGEIRDIQGYQSPVGWRLVVGRNNQKVGFFDIQP
jgi:hypothetical protein